MLYDAVPYVGGHHIWKDTALSLRSANVLATFAIVVATATVWIFYYPGKPKASSTSTLYVLVGDVRQMGDETSAAPPHFGSYTTRCFV